MSRSRLNPNKMEAEEVHIRESLEEKIAGLLARVNEELFNWRFDDIDYLGEANKLAERMNTLAKDAVVPSE